MHIAISGATAYHEGWAACLLGLADTPPQPSVLKEGYVSEFRKGWCDCLKLSADGRWRSLVEAVGRGHVTAYWEHG